MTLLPFARIARLRPVCLTVATAILVSGFLRCAYAQNTPQQLDAVLQQQAKDRQARVADELANVKAGNPQVSGVPENASTESTVSQYVADESPCFVIHQVRLDGENADSYSAPLREILSGKDAAHGLPSPIGRCLGAQSIRNLAVRLQNRLIDQGLVTTRVLVSPQDISGGTLMLTVLPGTISAIRASDTSDIRAHFGNALPVSTGSVLNLRDIEQGLENLRRLPTVQSDIAIAPGKEPGQSELLINWKQSRPLRLYASIDDAGNKATGKYQTTAMVTFDHFLTLNDIFYVSRSFTPGHHHDGHSANTAFHYSIPFGYWQLAFNTGQFDYWQQVPQQSQSYVYSGRSRNTDLALSRVIWRDSHRKTQLYLKGWQRKSRNQINGVEIPIQRRNAAGWELGLIHREYLSRGTLDATLAYKRGTGALGAMPAPEDSSDEGTSRFRLFTASVSLDLPFSIGNQSFRYGSALRGQWNRTRLTTLDQFAIGGRYTVRGFDGQQVLMGNRGLLWRNELALPLQNLGLSGHEIYVGLDVGKVGGPATKYLAGKSLSGISAGVRGQLLNAIRYELFAGRPLRKPENFKTARIAGGFSLSIAY